MALLSSPRPSQAQTTLNPFFQFGAGGASTTLNPNVQYGQVYNQRSSIGNMQTTLNPNVQFGNLYAPTQPTQPKRQSTVPTAPSPYVPPPIVPSAPKKIDYSNDPLLQQAILGQTETQTEADARRLRDQKELLLGFGSQELARKILGNDPFVNTISDDPFKAMSTLALNRRQEIDNQRLASEALNQNNLFFSSTRGNTLADITRQRLLADAQGTQQVQGSLNSIEDQHAQVVAAIKAARQQAEQEAYQRALEAALASGWGGAGGTQGNGAAAPTPGPASFTQAPQLPFDITQTLGPGAAHTTLNPAVQFGVGGATTTLNPFVQFGRAY